MKTIQVITLAIILLFTSCQTKKSSVLNEHASIKKSNLLTFNPLLEHAITSSINVKKGTMSTLYGNEKAWEYAKMENDTKYPKGSILYEVTWYQKSDSVWFGANIPKLIKSIERITYVSNTDSKYELFTGQPLPQSKILNDSRRIDEIAQQRLAVSP